MYNVTANTRITINLGLGDQNPVLILRAPSREELRAFLASRFERDGRMVIGRIIERREEFVDQILIGCENVGRSNESGEAIPLSPSDPDWKPKIPVNWKTAVALRFEEQETLSEGDRKN